MLIKRQPTTSEKALKFEFSIKGSKFLIKNFTDGDIYVDLGENEIGSYDSDSCCDITNMYNPRTWDTVESNGCSDNHPHSNQRKRSGSTMLKMVDGTGIIGVDMVCPLGGAVSPPQPPNYDKVEVEGVGELMLPNSLKAPLERLELIGNSVQGENPALDNPQEIKSAGK